MTYGSAKLAYGEAPKPDFSKRQLKAALVVSLGILPLTGCGDYDTDRQELGQIDNSVKVEAIQKLVQDDKSLLLPTKEACATSGVFNDDACGAIFDQAQAIHLQNARQYQTEELCKVTQAACEQITTIDGQTAFIGKMDAVLARPTDNGDLNLEPLYVQQDQQLAAAGSTAPAASSTTHHHHGGFMPFILWNSGGYGGYYSSPAGSSLGYATASGTRVGDYTPPVKAPATAASMTTPPSIKAAPMAAGSAPKPAFKIAGPALRATPSTIPTPAATRSFGNIGRSAINSSRGGSSGSHSIGGSGRGGGSFSSSG